MKMAPFAKNRILLSVGCAAMLLVYRPSFSQPSNNDVAIVILGPMQATAGEEVTYTFTITNTGPLAANNVVLQVPATANFTPSSISCQSGTSSDGNSQCPSPGDLTIVNLQGGGVVIPRIPYQGAVIITLVGNLAPGLSNYTTVDLTASITSDIDEVPENNSKTQTTVIHDLSGGQISSYYFDNFVFREPAVPGGGTFQMIFTHYGGPIVPGLGTSFAIPLHYSQMVNLTGNGVQYEWDSIGQLVLPDTVVYFTGLMPDPDSLFKDLPASNRFRYQYGNGDNTADQFMRNILNDADSLRPLGMYDLTFGEVPTFPPFTSIVTGYPQITIFSGYRIYNTGSYVRYATYTAPMGSLETTPDYSNSPVITASFNATYPHRFTAMLDDEEPVPTSILNEHEFTWINFGAALTFYTPDMVLPAAISNLSLSKQGRSALLEWSTTSEQNNKGFSILRSVDGVNWKTLDFVPSKARQGQSNEKLSYQYIDTDPVEGYSYYKLAQVDFDEKITYSQICSFRFMIEPQPTLVENPVTAVARLKNLPRGGKLAVFDRSGAMVIPQREISAEQEEISVSALAPGQYFIRVLHPDRTVTVFRLVKK